MNKKYIFLPVAGLIILSIGYYFFSLYRNSDNSPNESKTQPIEQTADTSTPTDEGDNSPNEGDQEQTADTISPMEYSNLPCELDNEQTVKADTTTPTDEDNLPSESDQQDAGEKYTVFIFYEKRDLISDSPYGEHILMPFFEVDLKHKTIKGIRGGFEKKEIYYRTTDGRRAYANNFDKHRLNPRFEDYETEYITTTNDFKQGEYFIDEKVDLGEQPKTTANIKLFFEAFFKDCWGRNFYEQGILDDIANIEKRTRIFIEKITDVDQDNNLEYWLYVSYVHGGGKKSYEVVDGKLVFIQEFYYVDGD